MDLVPLACEDGYISGITFISTFLAVKVHLCINVRLAYLYRRSKYWILPSIEAREICHRFTTWSNSKLSSQSTRKVCEGYWVLVGS